MYRYTNLSTKSFSNGHKMSTNSKWNSKWRRRKQEWTFLLLPPLLLQNFVFYAQPSRVSFGHLFGVEMPRRSKFTGLRVLSYGSEEMWNVSRFVLSSGHGVSPRRQTVGKVKELVVGFWGEKTCSCGSWRCKSLSIDSGTDGHGLRHSSRRDPICWYNQRHEYFECPKSSLSVVRWEES